MAPVLHPGTPLDLEKWDKLERYLELHTRIFLATTELSDVNALNTPRTEQLCSPRQARRQIL